MQLALGPIYLYLFGMSFMFLMFFLILHPKEGLKYGGKPPGVLCFAFTQGSAAPR